MDSSLQGSSWIDPGGHPLGPPHAPDALAALTLAADQLRARGDARAAFADVYAIITRRVTDSVALGPGRFFLEPAWISILAGRFCQRYLDTLGWSLDGRPQDAEAWAVAYASSERGGPPLANVLLGLSAHINYDLAIGIHATVVELGAASDPVRLARLKHDHDAVNKLLDASIPEAFECLIVRHRCPVASVLFHHAYAASRWAAMQVLTTWRARVWREALELVFARREAERSAVMRRMERRSGRYARLISAGWAGPRAARRRP
jgi:hypothetical protein